MTPCEQDESFEWVADAHTWGGYCLYVLIRAIEHGAEILPIDSTAWDNTMAAVAWALGHHVAGHVYAGRAVTEEDVTEARRLHRLGAEALAGAPRSPELQALAERCLVLLSGPEWRRAYRKWSLPADVYPARDEEGGGHGRQLV